MIHAGENEIDGIVVTVVRKSCRRINIRIGSDGAVRMTVPKWWATLREGEVFLKSKWPWVVKTREQVLARPVAKEGPVSDAEFASLRTLLAELNATWAARVGESNVAWKIRKVKSVWGCCHWRERYITYNAELARAPRELVEYVVVHEFTHFAVHGHGPQFYRLMDERLPGWKDLRRRLNRRDWGARPTEQPSAPCAVHQLEFAF